MVNGGRLAVRRRARIEQIEAIGGELDAIGLDTPVPAAYESIPADGPVRGAPLEPAPQSLAVA